MVKYKYLFLSFLLFNLSLKAFTQEKHALIIALSEYEKGTNWGKLNSFRDAVLITEALKHHGFDTMNIRVIKEDNGTKQGIVEGLEKLIGRVNNGDIVVFHFSGHGQPVMDRNGDELDGFDESIVPVDASKDFIPGVYNGQNHITDDELGALLTRLREKLGPAGDLMVTLDACQSGTATRGQASKRGASKPMAPNDYRYKANGISDTAYGLYEINGKLATMVVISATGPNETNWETRDENRKYVGSLSFALSKALISASEKTTYRGLYEKIKARMVLAEFAQVPQIEGNMDRKVWGGALLPQPTYFNVIKTSKRNKLKVTINAGAIHSVFPGSEVSLYRPDTRDLNTEPIVKGVVQNSDEVTADVLLEKAVNRRTMLASWGYITNRNFGKMRVDIQLNVDDEEFKSGFRKIIQDYPFIKLVTSDADLFVNQGRGLKGISLLTGNGTLLYENAGYGSVGLRVQNTLKSIIQYAQVDFLRILENYDPDLKVTLQIVPVSTRKLGRRFVAKEKFSIQSKIGKDGILTFQKGDYFVCHFRNEGNKGVYVSLLDIQPNGKMDVLLPKMRESASDYFIKPGETLELDYSPWQAGEPFGVDVLKLIATETALNLRSILDSQGAIPQIKGRLLNPFEELFANTFKGQEKYRSQRTSNLPPSTAHISNHIIRIVPSNNK